MVNNTYTYRLSSGSGDGARPAYSATAVVYISASAHRHNWPNTNSFYYNGSCPRIKRERAGTSNWISNGIRDTGGGGGWAGASSSY